MAEAAVQIPPLIVHFGPKLNPGGRRPWPPPVALKKSRQLPVHPDLFLPTGTVGGTVMLQFICGSEHLLRVHLTGLVSTSDPQNL